MKRGYITFVFDDGYTEVFQTIVPRLEAQGLVGVFGILGDPSLTHLEGHPLSPLSDWLPLRARGHEVASHGLTHRNLIKLPPDQVTHELKVSKERLSATTFIYPGGAYNQAVLADATKHYRAARTVDHGFETVPPQQRWQLKTYNFARQNFGVTKANALSAWAALRGWWLIETYHRVSNDLSTPYTVSLNDFEEHLAFIQQLPMSNVTIAQVT